MLRLEIIDRINALLTEVVALAEEIGGDISVRTWAEGDDRRSMADIRCSDTLFSLSNFTEPHVCVWNPDDHDDWHYINLEAVPYSGSIKEITKDDYDME